MSAGRGVGSAARRRASSSTGASSQTTQALSRRPAAAGEHERGVAGEHGAEGLRLERAELGLAEAREDLAGARWRVGGMVRVVEPLDLVVEVHEGATQIARELRADRGLAAAAQADERDLRRPTGLVLAGARIADRRAHSPASW